MKIFKSFVVTLAIVLAIGGIYLYSKDTIFNTNTEETAETSEETNAEGAKKPEEKGITGAIESAKKEVVKGVAKTVVNKAIEEYAEKSDSEVKEKLESITEEDKDKVSEIISENISLESMGDVESYISNKDVDGLMDYAQDKLTAEDYSELTGILEKYSDGVMDQIDGATN
ncbi:hypothetical protein [Butyrivibrio sp. INlla16]|uniref:hypothetical protein n=1 Tax=Butyrivibrio sp. INlla16 TaxID=1520807 RepID=UPI000889E500|nr:hypothetical protein [Butyrivibrio sp. INlla16]SDB27261.1 hypothetical protein SAMN02910263_01319 [Butyrivibrio sp. INlla16]